jgi:competence protein ComEC
VGLLGSTLIASFATAPFGAYHFHTLNPFGLLGNALALPLVSMVVMPCAVLGVVAFPFGLDRADLGGDGPRGRRRAHSLRWVSGFSGSSVLVPAFGAAGLAAFTGALLI